MYQGLIVGNNNYSEIWISNYLTKYGWKLYLFAGDLLDSPDSSNEKTTLFNSEIPRLERAKIPTMQFDCVFIILDSITIQDTLENLSKIHISPIEDFISGLSNFSIKKMVLVSSFNYYGIPYYSSEQINEETSPFDSKIFPICDVIQKKEKIVTGFCEKHSIPYTILRTGFVYGPGQYYGFGRLVYYMNYEMIPALTNNMHDLSYPLIHIGDLIRAVRFFAESGEITNQVFNLVDDDGSSILDICKYLAFHFSSKCKPFIQLPFFIIRWLARTLIKINISNAKRRRNKRIKNNQDLMPTVTWDLGQFAYGNFSFSNQKIKESGFKFKHLDRKHMLNEVIEFVKKHGMEYSDFLKYDINVITTTYIKKYGFNEEIGVDN